MRIVAWAQPVLADVFVPLGDGRVVLTLAVLTLLVAAAVVVGVLALGSRRRPPATPALPETDADLVDLADDAEGVGSGW